VRVHRCRHCGGDASEPDHRAHCCGRQGALEARLPFDAPEEPPPPPPAPPAPPPDDTLPVEELERLYAGQSHPDTSHAAAAAFDPKKLRKSSDHMRQLLIDRGPLADYEQKLAWRETWGKPCSDNLYRIARRKACDRGLIRDSGLTKKNPDTRQDQIVWEACDIGPVIIEQCSECGAVRRRHDVEAHP